MKKTFLILTGLVICVFASKSALSFELPMGLSLDPPEQLDLTYQILPFYDEKEKVIAGWDGEKLQYFVGVDQLPPGYLDAESYFSAIARDLRASWGGVETGKTISYQTPSGLKGSAVVFSKQSNAETTETAVAVHFITDGKQSFYATGSAVPPAAIERVLEDTVTLFRTARVSQATGRAERSEDELVGVWVYEGTLLDDHPFVSTTELKSDLSFSTNMRAGDTTIFSATGIWWRNADKLYWEYLYSLPAIPNDKRKDEDRIVSIQTATMELQSSLSGKKRVFKRASVQSH